MLAYHECWSWVSFSTWLPVWCTLLSKPLMPWCCCWLGLCQPIILFLQGGACGGSCRSLSAHQQLMRQ
jgi:hypothetical protein